MGVSTFIKIKACDTNNNEVFYYTTTNPCDGLALMLLNGENYKTLQKLDQIITNDQISKIKLTYDELSISVSEGYENYDPVFVDPSEILGIFSKIRVFYICKMLESSHSEDLYRETIFDIATLSELISTLSIAEEKSLKVVLTLSDC